MSFQTGNNMTFKFQGEKTTKELCKYVGFVVTSPQYLYEDTSTGNILTSILTTTRSSVNNNWSMVSFLLTPNKDGRFGWCKEFRLLMRKIRRQFPLEREEPSQCPTPKDSSSAPKQRLNRTTFITGAKSTSKSTTSGQDIGTLLMDLIFDQHRVPLISGNVLSGGFTVLNGSKTYLRPISSTKRSLCSMVLLAVDNQSKRKVQLLNKHKKNNWMTC